MEITCRLSLDDKDLIILTEDVARRVVAELGTKLGTMLAQTREQTRHVDPPGIQVVGADEAAKMLGKTTRHLTRMTEGPRRRKISSRRVGYFEHELQGKPAAAVLVRDGRRIDVSHLSVKLGGIHRRTIDRMVDRGELPAPDVDDLWLERDIDDWLLRLPPV